MVFEITNTKDYKQQQATFTKQNWYGRLPPLLPSFRHFQLTAEDSFVSLHSIVDGRQHVVWLFEDNRAFACDFHFGLRCSKDYNWAVYGVSDIAVCGRTGSKAASGAAMLASLPRGRKHFNMRIEPINNDLEVGPVPHTLAQDLPTFLKASGWDDGAQRINHDAPQKSSPRLGLCHLSLDETHTRELWSCNFQVDLALVDCSSQNWSLDVLKQRTESFGSLEFFGLRNVVKRSDVFRGEWNDFAAHLQGLDFPLFQTLTVSHLPKAEALELLKVTHDIHRLRMNDCVGSREHCRWIGRAIRSGRTPRCLLLMLRFSDEGYNDDSDSDNDNEAFDTDREDGDYPDKLYSDTDETGEYYLYNPIPIIKALASPQCRLIEFGLGRHGCTPKVRRTMIQALQRNTSLQKLTFDKPYKCWFYCGRLSLARAIHQHSKIQTLTFVDLSYGCDLGEEETRAKMCLPSMKYLLESDRHFTIEWERNYLHPFDQRLVHFYGWWEESLESVTRYQHYWRLISDDMTGMEDIRKDQWFQRILLRTSCKSEYRTKVMGLLLSKHMGLLKSTLEKKKTGVQ